VTIRKGGDVIPLIESVEIGAQISYPPEGTWEWDGPSETAVNIRQRVADASTRVSQFMKMVKHLDWPNVGPAVMKSVVDAGYTTIPLLRKASEDDLKKLLGPVKGQNLFKLVQKDGWARASEIDLFIASPLRPDGIGSTRLEALLEVEPNVTRWSSNLSTPKGWSLEALKEFQPLWKRYEEFRMKEWFFITYPVPCALTNILPLVHSVPYKGYVVFSGVRDKAVEAALEAKGYKVVDAVKSDTKAVLIADQEDPNTYTSTKTEKTKKVPDCKVLRRADWEKI
jgi:NAD-dependent DNA ligase